ncbi:hypothetical protein GCM10027436_44560 [Actinophytocola sediminis]
MRGRGTRRTGKHRLGSAGLRYCLDYRAVAEALVARRRGWWTGILMPTARHSLAGLRRRAAAAAAERAWAPAIALR